MSAKTQAAEYRERGWSPIPLKIRSKEPKLRVGHPYLRRKPTEEEFAEFDFRHNVGIVTGRASGIIVLDDDSGGETIKSNGWPIPPTPTVKTRRGHQYYFRCPEEGFPTCDLAHKVEVRGDGAYVAAPPSIHPSGDRYEWVISPQEAELADPPDWLMKQARIRGRRMAPDDVGEEIPNGARNKTLLSIAGTLRRRGLDRAGICAALLGINEAKCKPPLDEAEVRKIACSAARYEPAEAFREGPQEESPEANEEPQGGERANSLLAGRFDIGAAIRGGIDPPEELEPDVLLKGKIHHLFGPSESGKTIIGLWLVKRRVEAGERAVVFDAENGPRTMAERLKQMGADPDLVSQHLVYLPFPALALGERSRRDFYEILDGLAPTLILFDSWASFLSAAGLSENENSEIEDWDNALTKRAKQRGIASVILDHVPHEANRSRGGARKKEVADVQWRVKKTQDFDRDSVGEILLINEKDREGWLPGSVTFSVGGRFGTLICARSSGTVDEPSGSDNLTKKERTVLRALCEEFRLTGAAASQWQEATDKRGVSRATHFRAVKKLVSTEVPESHRVSLVDETYYPPDETGPRDPEETGGKRVGKPDARGSHQVSNGSHETDETGANPEVSQVSPPFKGETMRPDAESSWPEGLTPEAVIEEFMREGSGPARALANYEELPSDQRFEYVVRSVLTARKLDSARWREHVPAVQEAMMRSGASRRRERSGAERWPMSLAQPLESRRKDAR
jgi:hypothetical protein